jgi:hypothetical protein
MEPDVPPTGVDRQKRVAWGGEKAPGRETGRNQTTQKLGRLNPGKRPGDDLQTLTAWVR